MLTRLMTVLALALAAGLIAAGCGGDDDETTTTSPTTTTAGATGATGATGASSGEPLSKSEFTEAGDAICEEADAEIDPQTASPEEQADNVQEQLDGIRALTPPEGDEDQIEAILDAGDEGVQQLEETGDFQKAPALQEASQLAKQYGFKECGS